MNGIEPLTSGTPADALRSNTELHAKTMVHGVGVEPTTTRLSAVALTVRTTVQTNGEREGTRTLLSYIDSVAPSLMVNTPICWCLWSDSN
jgi:hypothetical protein